jgi:hypothetical protein
VESVFTIPWKLCSPSRGIRILGALDIHDCLLATQGDPGVEQAFRAGAFGLFQADRPEYPQHVHEVAAKYSHIRSTLHGVLFLFKRRRAGLLVYDLEQYLIWNPALIDRALATAVHADLCGVIPIRAA